MLLAYFGPEVAMPLASLAAGLVGLALMFWRRSMAAMRRAFRTVTRLLGRERIGTGGGSRD